MSDRTQTRVIGVVCLVTGLWWMVFGALRIIGWL